MKAIIFLFCGSALMLSAGTVLSGDQRADATSKEKRCCDTSEGRKGKCTLERCENNKDIEKCYDGKDYNCFCPSAIVDQLKDIPCQSVPVKCRGDNPCKKQKCIQYFESCRRISK